MILFLKKHYFRLYIKFLIVFKPAVLFEKINKLDWYKNMLHQWIGAHNIATKNKVLEVGCATGSLTAHIAESGCITTGVDSSGRMIELAKTKNNDINFLVANALDLPFDTDSFDVALSASLINIVPDKNKVIHELSRTCKKGGLIIVLVPSAKFNNEHLQSLQASLRNSDFSFAALEAWHHNAPKMEAFDISYLFKDLGMTEITIKQYLQGMVISVSALKPH